ncbi:MAG TPA: hypothetical protein VMS77_09200 [Conexivisphaerales archaeon]|nr:hypothetical protein [Conexivisphaerales archaeon]
MQRAAVRRVISSAGLVGSAVLVATPLVSGTSANTVFPGAIGILLAGASFYWNKGDVYAMLAGVCSLMLFAAYAGWGLAFWETFSNLGQAASLGLSALCVIVSIGYLVATAIAGSFNKD